MSELKESKVTEKTKFLLRNLLRGLIWLAVLVTAYLWAKKNLDFDLQVLLGPLYDNAPAVFSIFLISELVFGIIPPELFMFWALRHENIIIYLENVAALAFMSYFAGLIGYYIGSYFNSTRLYRLLRRNYLKRFDKHFNRYGGFLVVVAALTPLPFSGICMLVGAVKYRLRKFVWISLLRFVRFTAYGIIIWEANILN